jgi:hypothetical protein
MAAAGWVTGEVVAFPRDWRKFPLIGDKGYSSKKIRAYLRQRRIKAIIPERSDQIANRKRKGSRGGPARTATTLAPDPGMAPPSGRAVVPRIS